MCVDHGEKEGYGVLPAAVVPLAEVAVDLDADEIQDYVADVAVEQRADGDAPELEVVAEPRVEFVLGLEEEAGPGEGGLLAGGVQDDEHEEHY